MQRFTVSPFHRFSVASGVIALSLLSAACAPETSPAAEIANAIASGMDTSFATHRTLQLEGSPNDQVSVWVTDLGEFSLETALPDFQPEIQRITREWTAVGQQKESAPASARPARPVSWVGFRNIDDNNNIRVELWQAPSTDLANFGKAAQESGATRARRGSLPVTDEEDIFTDKSISMGIDTRTRRSIADGYSANNWPYRTIGRMLSGCTGTLIGQRTVLTAAHCIYRRDTGLFVAANEFSPRRDSGPISDPHGTATFRGRGLAYWLPAEYLESDCGGINCNAWDIAIIELSDNLGDIVGGMGWGYISASTLQTYNNYMRGYPSCSANQSWSPSRPDDDPNQAGIQCTSNALYGDTQTCDIASWPADTNNCWGDGWACELDITCDGSPGMSGSGVYTYDATWAGGNPVIVGVYSQYNCVPPFCSDPSENVITRITPTSAGFISAFKSANGSW